MTRQSNEIQYPRSAEIRRAMAACRKQNVDIGRILLHPNGTIELCVEGNDNEAASEFERLEAAGLL